MSTVTASDPGRALGPLPAESGKLGKLDYLYLSDNQLTNPIPDSFLDLGLSSFSFGNNEGLCAPDTEDFRDWLDDMKG